MTTLHTTLTEVDIENAQMADVTVIVPRPEGDQGMWGFGDIVDLITVEGTEYGGCYVTDYSATHLHVGVA